jgi:3-dehydroquinate synthetase
LHGEAVGWGMLAATLLAVARGRLGEREALRIIRLIASIGPLPPLGTIRAKQLRPILAGDKKARGGRLLWVLLDRIGRARWGMEVPWAVVSHAFRELPAVARGAGISGNLQAKVQDSAARSVAHAID